MAAADAMDFAPSPAPLPSDTDCSSDNSETVKALVIMAVVGLFLLHVLGSLRRRSSNSLIHAIVMAVYTLSYPLVSYIIGLMDRSDCYYYDFAVWAVFMLLLLGSTDSLTACRLDDIDNWKSIYVKHLFKAFLVVYVIVQTIGGRSHRDMKYLWCPLAAVLLVGVLKCYVRIASMKMVSKHYVCKKVKVIAEYMEHKDNLLVPFDPVTMKGYSYMVAGEKYCVKKQSAAGCTPWYKEDCWNNDVTTVEQIWQCNGRLLHLGKRGKRLKDLCLSMALSKMLNRRFAGFNKLSEAHLEKTHDFVFKGLLAGDEPHERAFRVIEEELAFVHDLYYTRYYYLHQKGRYMALCLPVAMFALCSWLTCVLIENNEHSLATTIFITFVLAFMEVYQLYLYIASGWFKVALIWTYISTPSLQRSGCCLEMIIGRLLRLKALRPWKGTLGQYCLLEDLGRRSWLRDCLHYATLGLMDKARKKKKGRKRSSVKLSEHVKKALVDSLLGSNGYLTNGVTSLQNNGVHARLSWACHAIATETILVWHIATTLCWQLDDAQAKEEDAVTTASTLSEYCMHLLAFAPKFLPDHSSVSESILEQSIEEAGQLLKGAKTLEQMCKILMDSSTTHGGDEAPLVVQGARLARHLMDGIQEPKLRWKVLSDFWGEVMLYVSPSADDARAHLEALARGGEFITHLWALLTHAGVLERSSTGPMDVV